MPNTIESAIQCMERLEVALLAAEARLKMSNTEAEIRLEQIRAEISALKLDYDTERKSH
jgi:hypothetical protein